MAKRRELAAAHAQVAEQWQASQRGRHGAGEIVVAQDNLVRVHVVTERAGDGARERIAPQGAARGGGGPMAEGVRDARITEISAGNHGRTGNERDDRDDRDARDDADDTNVLL